MLASGNNELNSAEMLAMRAEKHYQEQRFIEAAELYEQAAVTADANRQAENMYRYRRSAVHAWRKALEQLPPDAPKAEYQKRLIILLKKLVEQNPNHPDASNLHLSAIDVQARLALSQPATLDDYLALVKEHSEYWNDSPQLPTLRRLSVILLEQQGRFEEAAAMLPLLDIAQLETLAPEIQRLRVRQLNSEGKTQEAVDILAALLKQKQEPATLQLLAGILTRQPEEKSLKFALKFWTDLESITAKNSELWWSAREGIFEVLYKLNRLEEARESFQTLRILYPELGGTERKARLIKRFE
jgi:tetratricopeptide (TPR) repeat protein